MAEFTSFNGYQVKDTVARSIAKGRNQAVAFVDYETMIETLNDMEKDEYRAGQNIYIGVVGVPDLWVYSVEDIVHTFEFVSDEGIVEMLTNNTTIQVGYYKLAMLEGQKVDLTTYDQHLLKHDNDIAGLDNKLTDSLGGLKFSYDTETQKYGYIVKEADTDVFVPFSDEYYEEYTVTVNNNSTSQSTLKEGTIVSDDSNTLVSMTDDYLFTALKPCKVIIYHCGQSYSGNNTKICYVNGKNINSFTDVCNRFETTLEIGDDLYVARILQQAYWSTNVAYLRFEPI